MIKNSFNNIIIKLSELLAPSQILEYYNPQKHNDWDNLVHFHKLEYKISVGKNSINPENPNWCKTLLNAWEKSLRNIYGYYRPVFIHTLNRWVKQHSVDRKDFSKSRAKEVLYNEYDSLEEFLNYSDGDMGNYADNLKQFISGNPYDVNIEKELGQILEHFSEEIKPLLESRFDDLLDGTTIEDLIVNYPEEIKDIYEIPLDINTDNEEETISEYIMQNGIEYYALKNAIKEYIFKYNDLDYLLEISFEDKMSFINLLIDNNEMSILEDIVAYMYDGYFYDAFWNTFGPKGLSSILENAELVLDKLNKTDAKSSSLADIAQAMTWCINLQHTSGQMWEHIPDNAPEALSDIDYNFNVNEFEENTGEISNNNDWEYNQLKNITPESLNELSDLDLNYVYKELNKDGFEIVYNPNNRNS